MSFATTDLGPYKKYSYAVRLRDGVVYAARDRVALGDYNVHAAFWDGSWTLLPDPAAGVVSSVATGGTPTRICGGFVVPGLETFGRAAVWDDVAGTWTPTTLTLPAGALGSWASKISPDGEVVTGELHFGEFDQAAAIWTRNGGSWDVTVLPRPDVRAYGNGLPTGDGSSAIGNVLDRPRWYPVRWTNGSPWTSAPLPPPNGVAHADVYGGVENTNDGWSAGWFSVSGGPSRAMQWAPGAIEAEDIGVGDNSFATSTSNGSIVGVKDNSGAERAFYWTSFAGEVDIHPNGWDWSYPGDIDPSGRVVLVAGMGEMGDPSQDKSIFLLTPS